MIFVVRSSTDLSRNVAWSSSSAANISQSSSSSQLDASVRGRDRNGPLVASTATTSSLNAAPVRLIDSRQQHQHQQQQQQPLQSDRSVVDDGSTATRQNQSTARYTAADVESLETQIKALEAALELQERALSVTAATSAAKTALPDQADVLPALSTKSATAGGVNASSVNNHPQNQCFPYLQLLQSWRKQTLKSMMTANIAERELSRSLDRSKRERSALQARAVEAEGLLSSCRNRLAAAVEKHDKQSTHLQALECAYQEERAGRFRADQRVGEVEESLRKLKEFVKGYKTVMDENWVRGQVNLVKVNKKTAVINFRAKF